MKVVFDTNIFISSLFWKGNPRRAIDLAIHQHVQSVTSFEILQELQVVLSDDFRIPAAKLKDILRDILSYSQLIKINPVHVKIRDLDDLKIIACALTAQADYLVTGDKDLLALRQYDELKILTPAEFLKMIQV